MSATVPHKRHPSQAIQRNTKLGSAALPIVPTDVPKRRRTAAQPPPKPSTPTSAAAATTTSSISTVHRGVATATNNTIKNPKTPPARKNPVPTIRPTAVHDNMAANNTTMKNTTTPSTPAARKNPVTTRPGPESATRATVTSTAREDDEDEDEGEEAGLPAPTKTAKTATSHNTPYSSSGHKPMGTKNVDHNQTGHHKGAIPKSCSSGSSEPLSAHVNKGTETVTEPALQQTPPIVPNPTPKQKSDTSKVPTCQKKSPVAPLSTKKKKPKPTTTQNHGNTALNTGRAMGISDKFSQQSITTSVSQPTKCPFQVGVKPKTPEPSSRQISANAREAKAKRTKKSEQGAELKTANQSQPIQSCGSSCTTQNTSRSVQSISFVENGRGTPPLEGMTEEMVLRCVDGNFPVPPDATVLVPPYATMVLDGNEGDISDELYNKACTCLVKPALNTCKRWRSKAAADAARAVAEAKAKAMVAEAKAKKAMEVAEAKAKRAMEVAEAKAKRAMEVAEAKTKEATEAKAKADEARAVAEAKAKAVAEAQAKAAMEAKAHTNIVVKHNLDTVSKEAMNELRHYYMTGTGMVGSCKILVELEKTINSVQKAPFGQGIDKPFIILDGSSGMGKTQLAFSLKEDVIYLVYSGENQDIYKCFSHLSSAFRQSVLRDSGHLKQIDMLPYCHFLFSEQELLWTTAFFDWCFGEQWDPSTKKCRMKNTPHFNSSDPDSSNTEEQYPRRLPYSLLGRINHQITGPMTNSHFLEKWSWLPRKPVIFIDEMPGQNKKEELEFMRNLCRALGLAVILSGTNSRAVNMLNTDSSRIESTPYLWCHLFPRPSPPTVTSLKASRVPKYDQILAKCNEIDPRLADFVRKCCVTCRGLFVLAMLRHLEVTLLAAHPQGILSPLEVLDDLMAAMQGTVLQKKNSIYTTQVGRSGQVLMYFSGIKCASEVISKHFAYLYLKRKDAAEEESGLELRFWRKDGTVVEESHKDFPLDNTKFCGNIYPHPYSFFPTIKCEPLLFLSLCANYKCKFSFLNENREGIPLCQAWLNRDLLAQIQIHVKTQTERSTKSDGSILEQYAGVAIAAASHRGGLQGQKVLPFLTALVYHLYGSRCSVQFERLVNKRSIIPKSMQDMKIPFLSPTDDIFPPSLKAIPGVNVVELVRTDDQSQIDMKAGSCLIVEAKDHKKFRASDVETVLRKFNRHATAEPQLCLIFQKVMNKDPYVLHTTGPIYQFRVEQTEGIEDLRCLTPTKYGCGKKPSNKQGSQTQAAPQARILTSK
ncbi:hypothetical protein Pelo_2273 [Pelomyxa schiedti]|nr:hypothetical protein Pelo_2273 [Pelomyxa schiedti]